MSHATLPAADQPDSFDRAAGHGPTLRRWATALGLGGLIPFIVLAVGAAALDADTARMAIGAQIQYAGSVLSFIGALHWGVALAAPGLSVARTRTALAWSVVPSLYAWLATVAPDWQPDWDAAHTTLALLIAGFVMAWLVDRALYRGHPVPGWFIRLRTVLTAGATLTLLVTLLAVVMRR